MLLAGDDETLRHEIEERAAARGVAVEPVESLDDAAIERASCVILAERGDAVPASARVVLAAGRVLLLPRLDRSFGLEAGLDHLEFADADDAITLVEAYWRTPEAFARVETWARVKARSLGS